MTALAQAIRPTAAIDAFPPEGQIARSQAARHGVHTLTDAQVLTAILSTHHNAAASDLARTLLVRHRHFAGVLAASHAALSVTVSAAAATDIKLAADAGRRVLEADLAGGELLRNSKSLAAYLTLSLKGRTTEAFRVLWVDCDMRLMADELLWEGTVDFSPVLAREVYRRALEVGAHGVFLTHVHPSHSPEPSNADIKQTGELVAGLKLLGVRVHDHLIVANQTVTSMTAQGLI